MGKRCGLNRFAKLMSQAKLQARRKQRRLPSDNIRRLENHIAPNHLQRDSAYRRKPMICSSVNLFFTSNLLSFGIGLQSQTLLKSGGTSLVHERHHAGQNGQRCLAFSFMAARQTQWIDAPLGPR